MRHALAIAGPLGILIFVLSQDLYASPVFPCPKAVSSSDGRFLVLGDAVVKSAGRNKVIVASMSFQVFQKEDFINAKDRLSSTNTYWTDWPRWRLVLDAKQIPLQVGCLVPLISDDGEFLILLQTGPVSPDDPVVRVYRWDHEAREGTSSTNLAAFVSGISLHQLWPADRLTNDGWWTDSTPQWFADGTFQFSTAGQQLIYKTAWGTTVRINLRNGSVSNT